MPTENIFSKPWGVKEKEIGELWHRLKDLPEGENSGLTVGEAKALVQEVIRWCALYSRLYGDGKDKIRSVLPYFEIDPKDYPLE